MPAKQPKVAIGKFPLRLMPSVRRVAETFSQREGVSLNQFINVAVAEKLAHLQHEEWLAQRPKATPALLSAALAVLNLPTGNLPEAGDALPDGYDSHRKQSLLKKTVTRRKR